MVKTITKSDDLTEGSLSILEVEEYGPYTVYLRTNTGTVHFGPACTCSVDPQGPELIADGRSLIEAWVPNATDIQSWTFKSDSLGCRIVSRPTAESVIIQAGEEEGEVTLVAITSGQCRYEGILALTCGGDSGCASGDCDLAFGDGRVDNGFGSIGLQIGAGRSQQGKHGGFLTVQESDPSPALATPSRLKVLWPGPDTEVIRDAAGAVRQIKTPLGFGHVEVINAYEYEIRFYLSADLTSTNLGLYSAPGATPFTTWSVRNPDGPAGYDRLQITETRGASTRVFLFTFYTGFSTWVLADDSGLRTVSTWRTSQTGPRTETRVVGSGSGTAEWVRRTYQTVGGRDVLTEVRTGDEGINTTTTYQYYDAGALEKDRYELKQIDYPDGSWEIFEYAADGSKRVSRTFAAWGDQAPTTDPTLCKVTTYAYALTSQTDGVDDPGVFQPTTARKIVVTAPGGGQARELARSYRQLIPHQSNQYASEMIEKQCVAPGALWTASGNLTTTTRYFVSTNTIERGQVQAVIHPDGTASLYQYPLATVTVEASGQPDAPTNPSAIVDGRQTTTIFDAYGQIESRTTVSLPAQNPPFVLSEETYEPLDPLRRSYRVTDLGQRTREVHYGCCDLESELDWDGSTTLYTHDSWHRRVAETKWGIQQTNQLDAAGRVLVRKRIGSDQTGMWLEQNAYDPVGRLVRQTNALGGVSAFGEVLDPITRKVRKTASHPDGATSVQDFLRDGRLERATGTAAPPVRYEYGLEQDGVVWREYTKEIKLDANGADTAEWTKTYQDLLGRSYKTVYPDGATNQSWYNNLGQLWKSGDPDGVITLYQYNVRGELEYTVVDLDQDSVIDWTGTDRITRTLRDVTSYSGSNVQRVRTYVHTTDSSSATALVSMTQTSTDGLQTWQTAYKDQSTLVTTATVRTIPDANGNATVTVTRPDSSSQVSAYAYGRLTIVMRKDSGGAQVSQTAYQYEPHGRTWQVTDACNGATTYTYNNADQILTVTTPPPGNGEPGQVTTTIYDTSGRTVGNFLPDGTSTTNLYFPTGLLQKSWGARAYPVEYTYDAQGRMRTMTTWQGFSSGAGAATTRWNYHPQRGWLASKDYPDAATGDPPGTEATGGPVYTNTLAGRLQTRVWKRGVTTTYGYNSAGSLTNVTYTGGSVTNYSTTYTYDRRGRRKTALRNSITTTWTYNDADQPLTETHSGGTLSGLAMNWSYDNALRRDVVTAKYSTNVLQAAHCNYDTAGRLQTVVDGGTTATYAYHANSGLIQTLTFQTNAATRLTTTRTYDALNRLVSISSVPSGESVVSFAYLYNRANQRTRATLGDGTYWVYLHDNLGQVVSGRRYWQDGTEVLGQQFEYRFDDIGNRVTTGGRVSSLSDYTTNRLNQYTSRTVPPYVEVMGIANPTTNVTVNGNMATRKGEYFHHALSVPNGTAQYPTITVTSQYGSGQSRTGEVFVAQSPEAYAYDADGNLTNDGRWTYDWDGENHLIRMVRDTSTPTLSSRLKLEFEYDHQGRRIRKYFFTHNGSAWVEQRDTVCLYEGWNVIAELNANASNAKLRTYVWGSDLSGTVEGAGGVGGLLWLNNYQTTYDGQSLPTGIHFVSHDGNGNVTALTRATDGSVSARYEYGPFGEPVRQTGTLADAQPFRFSTKWTDAETGLIYYGYRFYNPVTGRWLSRDPIAEIGGLNLYGFAYNSPIGNVDADGREIGSICPKCGQYKIGPWCPRCDQPPTVSEETAKFVVGLTPVIGSAMHAESNFSQGNYGWGAFYSALAVSDVLLVRSIATGLGEGCWKVGSHTWSATRSWFGRTRSLAPNTEVHRWLLQQNEGVGRWFPEWFKNQPWNLVVIDSGVVHGARYSSKTIHLAVHGTSRRLTLNWIERAAYGTPDWAQWAALNFSMRATTVFEQDCQCSLEHPGQTVIKEGDNQIVIPSGPSSLDPVLVLP